MKHLKTTTITFPNLKFTDNETHPLVCTFSFCIITIIHFEQFSHFWYNM